MINVNLDGYVVKPERLRKEIDAPFFHSLKPDCAAIRSKASKYQKYRKIVLLGNGGAVNSFVAISKALSKSEKMVTVINSMEPDLIAAVKRANPKAETLCIVSSTSGTNVGALEMMSQFLGYPMFVMTAENDGALRRLAEMLSIDHMFVPHNVDRFQTSSALAYFPLALLDVDFERLDAYLHKGYELYARPGLAQDLAGALYSLEKKGYVEVFTPIYSCRLESFATYIMQLMHESVCKQGRGQTYLVVSAPESQHHTNQRFFGGRKDICGLFLRTSSQDEQGMQIAFPSGCDPIRLRDGTVGTINRLDLSRSFACEFEGTYRDARANRIPVADIDVGKVDAESVGMLLALLHYLAVYSSALRSVNPFDQPQVEKSKEIAFSMRAESKAV
jgi:glucose-6-phosphate isomerase